MRAGTGGKNLYVHRHGQIFPQYGRGSAGKHRYFPRFRRRQTRPRFVGTQRRRPFHQRTALAPHDARRTPGGGSRAQSGYTHASHKSYSHDVCARPGRKKIHPHALADVHRMPHRLSRRSGHTAVDVVRHQRNRRCHLQKNARLSSRSMAASRYLRHGQRS